MKSKVTAIILAIMAMALALGCGPGNGDAPYTAGQYVGLRSDNIASTYTLRSMSLYHQLDTEVYNRDCNYDGLFDTGDNTCTPYAPPMPNIEVYVTFRITSDTISNFVNYGVLFGDDNEVAIGTYGSVKSHSDFHGRVSALLFIPLGFSGTMELEVSVPNDSLTEVITVIFDSGTTCTDGEDNNNNGFTDAADTAFCPNGFGVEPTAGGGTALSALQSPAGRLAVGGVATIVPTGGTGPYTFVSSSPGVATVDAAGTLTGISLGTAGISVTDATATVVTVNVTVAPLSSITLPISATVAVAATTALTATFLDATATPLVGLTLLPGDWISDAPGVATVAPATNVTASVTGVATGTAHITASYGVITSNQSTITVP